MFNTFSPEALASFFFNSFKQARIAWLRRAHDFEHRMVSETQSDSRAVVNNSYLHSLAGPDREDLACDILGVVDKQASRTIVFISGTHGIEGYAGSAIQNYLLQAINDGDLSIPTQTDVLFVHALNPWGMAWARRCDEQGIDLNRNFVNFTQPLPQDPNYHRIKPWLMEPDSQRRRQGLQILQSELGQFVYDQAISSGQYEDAKLPFFGGYSESFSRNIVDQLIKRYCLEQKPTVVIDLHTGLGPWSYGELICDHPVDSANERFARQLFGTAVAVPATGNSFSVPKHGLLDYAWHRVMSDQSCYLTLEFGSYDTNALFDVIISDHQVWYGISASQLQASTIESDAIARQRGRMFEHFCPADHYWRQSVLFKSAQVAHRLFQPWS